MRSHYPPQPHYVRVKRYVLEGIASGQWPAHQRIPSEGELTRHFGVSRMTANRALRELASEGHITRIQGVGSFAAGPKAEATLVEVRDIRLEIEARGQTHRSRVITHKAVRTDDGLADAFGVARDSVLFYSRIVHVADATALQLEERYVNPALAPDYLEQDLALTTPHEYLMRIAPLERAEHRIEAEMPSAAAARWLGLKRTDPLLILHRRTWSEGQTASVAKLSYPAASFRLVGHLDLKPSVAPAVFF